MNRDARVPKNTSPNRGLTSYKTKPYYPRRRSYTWASLKYCTRTLWRSSPASLNNISDTLCSLLCSFLGRSLGRWRGGMRCSFLAFLRGLGRLKERGEGWGILYDEKDMYRSTLILYYCVRVCVFLFVVFKKKKTKLLRSSTACLT